MHAQSAIALQLRAMIDRATKQNVTVLVKHVIISIIFLFIFLNRFLTLNVTRRNIAFELMSFASTAQL